MNALDLYTAARRLFPDAVAISAYHFVQTDIGDKVFVGWSLGIWDGPIGSKDSHPTYYTGATPEEVIAKAEGRGK